jgi:maleate isomerase
VIDLACSFDPEQAVPAVGIIVLQVDETLETEIRRMAPDMPDALYTSRIPSAPTVTPENLAGMEDDLTSAAALLPPIRFGAVGYACTSATSVIGSDKVDRLIRAGCDAAAVTNPIRAIAAYAAVLGVSRFALVSPYTEDVVSPLRTAFAGEGVETPVFGSFGVAEEHLVARISCASVVEAGMRLGASENVDAVFLSCTNLRTLDAAKIIENRLQKPVISSNSALAWHLQKLSFDQKALNK